jgi:deoxycytidine triphosphate deaminase
MFISPITAIENGWVKFPDYMTQTQKDNCIQPNALDFTLDHVFTIDATHPFYFSETYKRHRGGYTLLPRQTLPSDSSDGLDGLGQYWSLEANSAYDGLSDFYITVPKDVAALFIVRSTLNRNGLFITSGLYDSGFQGSCGVVIHNRSGVAYIAPHTRIGQLMFVKSESSGIVYAGGYNTKTGQHWSEANK